jgi:YD repeat-containing protein
VLNRLKEDPGFYLDHREAIESLHQAADASRKARFMAARKQLVSMGILKQEGEDRFQIQSIRAGAAPVTERLTAYEKNMLARYHAEVMSSLVYPRFLSHTFKVHFVDQRVSTPKSWRDIYRYDTQGNLTGWTRRDADGAREFNMDGLVAIARDAQGRALKAQTVKYEYDPPLGKPAVNRTLRQTLGNEIVHYEYDGENDRKGRITKREAAGEKK